MELKEWPKAEHEYWEAIEGLGGFIWRMNHDLAHGRIEDLKGKIDQDITEAQEISKKLVKEVCEKFGVVLEKSEVVSDKIYYWDWYSKMKENWLRGEYEKIICSVCPFSEGVEEMIITGGNIPCSKWNGILYDLSKPFLCAMTAHNWTEEELRERIIKKGGIIALEQFERKERALKAEDKT